MITYVLKAHLRARARGVNTCIVPERGKSYAGVIIALMHLRLTRRSDGVEFIAISADVL